MDLFERAFEIQPEPDPFPSPKILPFPALANPPPASSLPVVEKEAKLPSKLAGRVLPDKSLSEQYQRIGGPLTPVGLSNVIREADTGNIRRLMELANEARQKDGHLSAVLSQGEETIAGLDAMGADYQENLVSAINLRQIFTPDPNNVLLELNFFAD